MTKKLFIVHTNHTGYDEHDPYIVLAENEQEAKQLVEKTEEYAGEARLRKLKPSNPLGIRAVEEISLTDSKIVWKVFNPN